MTTARNASMLALALITAQTCGCGSPSPQFDDARVAPEQSVQPEENPPSYAPYCYSGGGSYWCQDWFSQKWCTNYEYANGWDWTGCRWSGWSSEGQYCSNGYLWDSNGTHVHCP
jgi:hypothetical protein